VFDLSAVQILMVLVIALLVFGPKRLPDLARKLGEGVHELKGAMTSAAGDLGDELRRAHPDAPPEPPPPAPAAPADSVAPAAPVAATAAAATAAPAPPPAQGADDDILDGVVLSGSNGPPPPAPGP